MDLMLSLSRHCCLEGGLAQWSAPGCVVGGGGEAGGWSTTDLQRQNINLATVSNFLRKCSLEGGLAQLPALLYSE